jgi:hypothetical protein
MGSHFHAVPAQLHAAPGSGVILRRIVKKEDARRVATFLYEGEIA